MDNFLTINIIVLHVGGVIGFILTFDPIYLLLPLYVIMKINEKD